MHFSSLWWEHCKKPQVVKTTKLLLLFLTIFSLPLNLFYQISLEGAFVNGLLIDYLIPKLYLFEIPLLLLLIIESPWWRQSRAPKYLGYLLLLLFLRQLLSATPLAALSHLFHLCLFVLLWISLQVDPFWKKHRVQAGIYGALVCVVLFQTGLALYQFVEQRSLFAYYYLGESQLSELTNISRGQFFFGERLLPYGSTAHPNILAGIIALFSILLIQKTRSNLLIKLALAGNALLIVYLTQSWSALITLGLFGIYSLIRHHPQQKIITLVCSYLFLIILPLAMSYQNSIWQERESVYRRQALNQSALLMIRDYVWWGVGLNSFTGVLEKEAALQINREVVSFIQPVHHALLLIFAEGGVLLLIILVLLIRTSSVTQLGPKTLVLLGILSLDHYLFSQAVGLHTALLFYMLVE